MMNPKTGGVADIVVVGTACSSSDEKAVEIVELSPVFEKRDSEECCEKFDSGGIDKTKVIQGGGGGGGGGGEAPVYRLYPRRFVGLVGLVALNIVSGMTWPWFGPISNNTVRDLGYTLDQVNWLGNVTACAYLPVSLLTPALCAKYGLRRSCDVGAVMLLLSGWIRYAGIAPGLSHDKSYVLVIFGQLLAAISQPIFQVLGPKYSEAWFDLKGRTTATMIIAISNPVGSALGQLLSPLVGTTKQSILVLGIISTAVVPFVFLISNAPPTPPTYAGSKPPQPLSSLLRAMAGMQTVQEAQMTLRERVDFGIITLVFGVFAAGTAAFSILTAEIMQPAGYSDNDSGFLGACLLLSGLVAAVISAPLFDRVFTYRLALTTKIIVPVIAGAWLSLVWAVRPHNLGGLFAIMALLGSCSVTLLPVALELAVEVTRNANASSSILWTAANLFTIVFVLVQGALRAGSDADPPLNMRRALVFNGAVVMSFAGLIIFLQGRQVRKERDEQELRESKRAGGVEA